MVWCGTRGTRVGRPGEDQQIKTKEEQAGEETRRRCPRHKQQRVSGRRRLWMPHATGTSNSKGVKRSHLVLQLRCQVSAPSNHWGFQRDCRELKEKVSVPMRWGGKDEGKMPLMGETQEPTGSHARDSKALYCFVPAVSCFSDKTFCKISFMV